MHQLHIERHGEGPLVVFTHGGGDTMATWAHQIGHFAGAGWSTLGWDLRGHGRSAAPHDPAYYSRDLAIEDLEALAVPVLQIVGARDEMFLRSTNYMATKLTGPTITHVVPGAGHHVHRGAADITNRAIEAFLQGLPPSN